MYCDVWYENSSIDLVCWVFKLRLILHSNGFGRGEQCHDLYLHVVEIVVPHIVFFTLESISINTRSPSYRKAVATPSEVLPLR